ncbi:glycoside hydrolase family 2 TIM barrel-domain containing protein [Bacteroides cellulosilyticus]|jgi:beta-galactosidase|uniref:glycoside hydrolase family 2 TIM barrel-domain containing protein n=1 Tax=Bacteroides cellulosilyticus TaxID=246787 RepID=UPI001899C000|nr:glycoside hydrolase family 2 TIM barrel-domain containing protein [Bacteroides cellulosilyticus]
MKRLLLIQISCFLLFLTVGSCTSAEKMTNDRRQDFTAGWTFHLGDDSAASRPDYDDTAWRILNLPHDWAIEGEFSRDNPSGTGGGALPGGIGWYRKTFTVDKADEGKRLYIDFDGVYMNSEVFINGHSLGVRPYGYVSFSYDLTPYIKWGGKNVVAVRVDNGEQPNSRWYSGCGIYRNVWLTKLNPVHIAQWGTFITAEDVSKNSARLNIRTKIQYDAAAQLQDSVKQADGTYVVFDSEIVPLADVVLQSRLMDAEGNVVDEVASELQVIPTCLNEVEQEIVVKNPNLWSVNTPYIYKVNSILIDKITGKVLDNYCTNTGIRTFRFDAQKGFILNGERLKINGVCMHHDLGCLGAAVNIRAIERQLEILQEMGCNGIRCSHNPPSPELLDLCDRMGFIVMDETFDMWRKRKTAHDYSRYFNEWHERDLTDLILRDRNHPSVFIWSIGNEVLEQWSDAKADTLTLEQANLILNFGHDQSMLAKEGEMSVNSLLTKKLADMVKALDSTRPVTAGCNEPNPNNHLFRSEALDLIGFNYHDDWFAGVPEKFPGKPFIVAESVSALMTRGYYRMPSDETVICPERWDKPYFDDSFSCSSYDNCHVPWGNSHEGTMRHVKNNDFISGQYVWTGFDYLGEPTPYGWPARSSYFGIVDLAGFPKDVYYLYQSEWHPEKKVLHLFPHWNWTPGQDIDMWAYYNNADEVELFVNGESQGVRTKGKDDFHVVWRVKYESGVVKVVSRKDGKTVLEKEIHTAGEPAQIRLTADRNEIKSDGRDLSFVTVEVLDKDGNLCPNADNQIMFDVQGAGFIAGVDNGSPVSMEKFKADHRKAFYGKCLVVVQSDGKSGGIKLTATSEGLKTAVTAIKAK